MEIISFLLAVLGFLGPIGLTGFFIVYMIKKQGWKLAQIVAGLVFGLMIASTNPNLPSAIHNGIQQTINSIAK